MSAFVNNNSSSLTITSANVNKVIQTRFVDPPPTCRYIPMTGIGALNSECDALKEIIFNLTSVEQKLLYNLMFYSDKLTNRVTLKAISNKNQSQQRSKNIRILIDKKIIKKVKVREYLINPDFLVPHPDFRNAIDAEWESLP